MGNIFSKKTIDLQLMIDVTKEDIEQDYDLSTIEGVEKANEELINAFCKFNDKEFRYVKTQLFTKKSRI